MKLLFCRVCEDVVKLGIHPDEPKQCNCKKSSGYYESDGLHAVYSGPCLMLGIDNTAFKRAINHRDTVGWPIASGLEFKAFIIPETAKTVRRDG